MNIFSSTKILEQALNGASLKHRVISANIANHDTPNYKSSEVSFETTLSKALSKPSLKSYRVHNKHFRFSTETGAEFQPKVHSAEHLLFNHNRNNVDMDYEMAQLAKNQIWYTALIERTNGGFQNLKKVINEGR